MFIINQTPVPDHVLRNALTTACQAARCRSEKIVVKCLSRSNTNGPKGVARRSWLKTSDIAKVQERLLKVYWTRGGNGPRFKRHIGARETFERLSSDGGKFEVDWPSWCRGIAGSGVAGTPRYDWLEYAIQVWGTMVHEAQHVADMQHNRKVKNSGKGEHRRFGDYNRRWADRPQERRSIHSELDAKQRLRDGDCPARWVDAVLDLAIAMEQGWAKSTKENGS